VTLDIQYDCIAAVQLQDCKREQTKITTNGTGNIANNELETKSVCISNAAGLNIDCHCSASEQTFGRTTVLSWWPN
jgi:hypothetical protein